MLLFLGGPGRAFEQSPEGSEGVRQGGTWGGNRADLFRQLKYSDQGEKKQEVESERWLGMPDRTGPCRFRFRFCSEPDSHCRVLGRAAT